jgi:ATP synthase I chain
VAEDVLTLQRMQSICWICLLVMIGGALLFGSLPFAGAVLLGGVISVGSFWLSHREVIKMFRSVAALPALEDRQAEARKGQKGYLIKFWLRLVLTGVVLVLLIKSRMVDVFGLILGLSTVVLAVMVISLDVARHYLFRGRR